MRVPLWRLLAVAVATVVVAVPALFIVVGFLGFGSSETFPGPPVPIGVADPADPWSGRYAAQGGVSARTVSDWERYPAPEGAVAWNPKGQRLTFMISGSDFTESLHYGVDLVTSGVRARRVRRFVISEPTSDDGEFGNYTYGFRLDRPVRWSDLRVGASDAATARSGGRTYLVTVTRSAPAVWDVGMVADGAPVPHAVEVEMTIAADRPDPPWHTITIDLRTELVDGARRWHLDLDRIGP